MRIAHWIIALIVAAAAVIGAFWFNNNYTIIGGQVHERNITTLDLSNIDLDYPERLAELKGLEVVDLRNTGLTPEEYDLISEILPDCKILWMVPFQGKYLDTDTTELTITTITDGEIARLAYFPNLKVINMEKCPDVEFIMKVLNLYPQCEVQWLVPFQGKSVKYDIRSLSLSSLTREELNTISYFTYLESIDARELENLEAVMALRQQYPDVEISWQVPIQGKFYNHDTAALKIKNASVEELMTQLKYLPYLESLTFSGNVPDNENIHELQEAYPDVEFIWDFQLCGITVNSSATQLDFSEIQMRSVEEVEKSLKYFNCLKTVVMYKCGISSEEMDALWKRHPEVRFVWGAQIGYHYIRTDATTFMPWKLGYARDGRRGMNNNDCEELKYLVDLVAIDIGHNRIVDLSFLEYTPKVEYLVISDTTVTDITPISNLKKLKYLEIYQNPITDLSPLAECTALEDINLTYISASDLSPLYGLNLKHIWLNGSHHPKEQVDKLLELFPDSTIQSNCPAPTSYGWRKIPNYFVQRDLLEMFYLT